MNNKQLIASHIFFVAASVLTVADILYVGLYNGIAGAVIVLNFLHLFADENQ